MNFSFAFRCVCLFLAFRAGFASDVFAGPAVAADLQIQLQQTAVVHGNRVLLSSIATVSGSDPVLKKKSGRC